MYRLCLTEGCEIVEHTVKLFSRYLATQEIISSALWESWWRSGWSSLTVRETAFWNRCIHGARVVNGDVYVASWMPRCQKESRLENQTNSRRRRVSALPSSPFVYCRWGIAALVIRVPFNAAFHTLCNCFTRQLHPKSFIQLKQLSSIMLTVLSSLNHLLLNPVLLYYY